MEGDHVQGKLQLSNVVAVERLRVSRRGVHVDHGTEVAYMKQTYQA